MPGGNFKDYRAETHTSWRYNNEPHTPKEESEYLQQMEAHRRKLEQQEKDEREAAAKAVKALVKQTTQARIDHPYLKRKGVEPVNLWETSKDAVDRTLGAFQQRYVKSHSRACP